MKEVNCPYCGSQAEFVDSKEVYGRSYGMIYLCRCKPEFSYVGTHKDTDKPLGRLADRMLREYKKKAHAAFDPIWRSAKMMTRTEAYKWLSKELGIPGAECHIGMFDVEMCEKVIAVSMKKRLQRHVQPS